jgi:hypothetical protein
MAAKFQNMSKPVTSGPIKSLGGHLAGPGWGQQATASTQQKSPPGDKGFSVKSRVAIHLRIRSQSQEGVFGG